MRHGAAIQAASGGALPALRALQKALARLHEDLAATCESNMCVCLPGAAGAAALSPRLPQQALPPSAAVIAVLP